MNKKLTWGLFFCIILQLLNSFFSHSTDKIVIASFGAPNEPTNLIAKYILREAYKQLDIDLQLENLPGLRALKSANDGETDGSLIRIKGIDKEYPNLHIIPLSFVSVDFVVFTKKRPFKISGWESLKKYTISYLRGTKIIETKTKGMKSQPVNSLESAFSMLTRGRADIVVETHYMGLITLNKLKLKNIKVLEPPLEIIPLYHYLNKKHQALIPQLNDILKNMKKTGKIDKLTKKALKESMK